MPRCFETRSKTILLLSASILQDASSLFLRVSASSGGKRHTGRAARRSSLVLEPLRPVQRAATNSGTALRPRQLGSAAHSSASR